MTTIAAMSADVNDVQLEVPFTLSHPNCDEDEEAPAPAQVLDYARSSQTPNTDHLESDSIITSMFDNTTSTHHHDLIFEDFARLRLTDQENTCEEA